MFKYLLFPLSIIYGLIIRLRNHLYSINIWKSVTFDINIISIGGLDGFLPEYTPVERHVTELITSSNGHPGILQRSSIFKQEAFNVKPGNSEKSHDEISNKEIPVFSVTNSVMGVPELLFNSPDTNVIILRNGFSERNIEPRLNVMVTSALNLFSTDNLYPVGNLLEPKSSSSRADCIVITDIQNSDEQYLEELANDVKKYSVEEQNVFLTTTFFEKPKGIHPNHTSPHKNIILCGLGHEAYSKLEFSDGTNIVHQFTPNSIAGLKKEIDDMISHGQISPDKEVSIIAHQKHIPWIQTIDKAEGLSIFYLPMKINFLKDRDKFAALIQSALNEN